MRHMIDNDATYSFNWKKNNIKDVVFTGPLNLGRTLQSKCYESLGQIYGQPLHLMTKSQKMMGDNLLQLVETIPGCEEAVTTDTNEWMAADSESSENLTDDDIVAAVT